MIKEILPFDTSVNDLRYGLSKYLTCTKEIKVGSIFKVNPKISLSAILTTLRKKFN